MQSNVKIDESLSADDFNAVKNSHYNGDGDDDDGDGGDDDGDGGGGGDNDDEDDLSIHPLIHPTIIPSS